MMKRPVAASGALFLAIAAAAQSLPQTGEIVAHLARTIAWYRHVAAVEQASQSSGDVLAHDGPQQTATRALQLAFEFARNAAPIMGRPAPTRDPTPASDSPMERAVARAAERVAAAEARLAQVEDELTKAGAQTRPTLTARRKELLAELTF